MKIKSMSDYNRLSGLCARALDNQKIKVLVSADTGGVAVGALEIYHQLKELIEEQGLLADLDLSRQKTGIGIKKSGCFGCFE